MKQPSDTGGPAVAKLGFWARLWDRFGPVPSAGPVCIATLSSRVDAEMMIGYLRTNGINAHMSADDAGGIETIYPVAFGVRVLVAASEADDARRLVEDVQS